MLNNKITVVQSNELIEASYSLGIDSIRIIMIACSKLDSRKPYDGGFFLSVNEFAAAFPLDSKTSVYSKLRQAAKELIRKPIKIYNVELGRMTEISWIMANEYDVGLSGAGVTVHFTPHVVPYLTELKERFTQINFECAAKLDTPFSFRLYQWLMRVKNLDANKNNRGEWEVVLNVNDMKYWAQVKGDYSRFGDFKSRMIEPSVQRINANTDISVSYELIRTGRSVSDVRFIFKNKGCTVSRPVRPRLIKRPKIKAGSHAEGEWMRKNLSLLLEHEKALKAYDPSAKLALADLRKMAEYASIAEPELKERLKKQIDQRTA